MIEVKDLVKRYGDFTAVDHISFSVEEGKIYGFLGPNGAGKTTTMNIMTGYSAATSGQVLVGGHDILEDPQEARKCIGYLPEQPPVYPDMKVREYLLFAGQLKGIAKNQLQQQVQEVMETCGITDMQNRLIKNLSKGYRQRVGLAQAILGYPPVIILDEPTVGLDPKQIIEIRDLIRSLGEKHTVLLSSHILSEVSAVCDVVLILSHGRLVAGDTPENLSRLMQGSAALELQVKGSRTQVEAVLRAVPGVAAVKIAAGEDRLLQVTVESGDKADLREAVFYTLAEAKCPIYAMEQRRLSLEDVFLELTEDTAAAADTPAETQQQQEEADNGRDL